jgi:hypothetical protein
MKVTALTICVLAFITSCSQPPPESALPGTYCFSTWNVHDSLFVNKDRTYRYEVYYASGKISTSSGKWEYNSFGGEITFENFSFPNSEGNGIPPGYWHSKVRVTDKGEVHLMYSSENNIYFAKKK